MYLGLGNYIFGNQYDTHEFLIHIHNKCFPDIDQSLFQNKVTVQDLFDTLFHPHH